jgi:hypothetical protein
MRSAFLCLRAILASPHNERVDAYGAWVLLISPWHLLAHFQQ